MRNLGYDAAELSLLCKEYKETPSDWLLSRILELIDAVLQDERQFRIDSAFFEGELTSNIGERNVRRPTDVENYRKRRTDRIAKRRADAEEEEKPVNHGNTRLPYGLCKKYGIEVQPGWTPHEAWEALEGKGVSAKEEYKKLRERGASRQTRTPEQREAVRNSFSQGEKDYSDRIHEIWQKQIDLRSKEIDIEYGELSRCKSELLKAEQRSTRCKKSADIIAGRTHEEVEKEYNETDLRLQKVHEMNRKLYDRPNRKDPNYAEWKQWVESNGGFEAVNAVINKEMISKDGALERLNLLTKALNDYDKYGPDAGYKEANAEVKKIKKQKKEIEARLEENHQEGEELERQSAEIKKEREAKRQEYYNSVKEDFPTLDDCKTTEELAERLTAEGLFTGKDVSCGFEKGIPMETAMRASKELLAFAEKFPSIKGHCNRLVMEYTYDTNDPTLINCYGYSDRGDKVVLNAKWFGKTEEFEKKYQADLEEKFHPPGTTINSVVHHEYAHQLDRYFTEAFNIASGDFSGIALNAVASRLDMPVEECRASVSRYAVENNSGGAVEWFAEALSEFTCSSNPRPVAIELGKFVNEWAQKLNEHNDSADRVRLDADDEEGRWVTTENDHKVHINEEGVPDKGNPFVLATMRGEGKYPKTKEEVTRHRLQRKAAQIKTIFADVEEARKVEQRAHKDKTNAEHEFKRAEMQLKVIGRRKKFIEDLGYGEDDYDRLAKDQDEAFNEMMDFLQDRNKWNLSEEEKEKFSPLEARYNQLHAAIMDFRDCFGEDAITEERVSELKDRLEEAEKRLKDTEKARERAEKEIPSTFDNIEREKFLSSEERSSTVDDIKSSKAWGDMTESGKAVALKTIESASDAQLLILKKTLENARINNSYGGLSSGGAPAWYTYRTGAITMSEECMENDRTLWHEYGHYLDDAGESGCGLGERNGIEVSLSDSLYDEYALHSEAVAKDLQKLVDEFAPDTVKIEVSPWGSAYLSVTDLVTGELAEGNYDMVFSKICEAVCEKFRQFVFQDREYEDFLDSIGCPHESEEPKYRDYIDIYYTPKRHLLRQREKYKGAEDDYRRKYEEYSQKRDAAIEAHKDEFIEQSRAYRERREGREKMEAPVSDILCGVFNGRGPWIYGSHTADYYGSDIRKPYEEAVANYHQMRVMGWDDGLKLLKSIAPSVHDSLEKTYNLWLWRNVNL